MENNLQIAIGSYTERAPHVPDAKGRGIVIARFDDNRGCIVGPETVLEMTNPSYLHWNRKLRTLFALSEIPDEPGIIRAFSPGERGEYKELYSLEGPGPDGCHLTTDRAGRYLFAASYSGGSLIGYDLASSQLPERILTTEFHGSGTLVSRQDRAHAHQVLFGPQGRYIYTCDLGSDKVWKQNIQKPGESPVAALDLTPGYGPRHMAFDRDGKHAYILCELKPLLLVVRISDRDGSFSCIQEIRAVPEEFSGSVAPAAVKIHPTGKTLVASNRFADTVAYFAVERKDENVTLRERGSFSSGGKTPRDMSFSPSGRWLLVGNQDSDDIHICGFDAATGLPVSRNNGENTYKTGSPVCIAFTD